MPLNVFCGLRRHGEFATVHGDNLVKIDKQMPLDRAALIRLRVMTGVGAAVNTARVEAGSVAWSSVAAASDSTPFRAAPSPGPG